MGHSTESGWQSRVTSGVVQPFTSTTPLPAPIRARHDARDALTERRVKRRHRLNLWRHVVLPNEAYTPACEY